MNGPVAFMFLLLTDKVSLIPRILPFLRRGLGFFLKIGYLYTYFLRRKVISFYFRREGREAPTMTE